jgi:hypothetical protein
MLAETLLSVFGIPLVVGAYLLVSDKKEHGGQFFWRRSRLFSTGIVLDHAHHSEGWAGRIIVHTVDLVIDEPAAWGLKSTNPNSAEREADKAQQRALLRGDKT